MNKVDKYQWWVEEGRNEWVILRFTDLVYRIYVPVTIWHRLLPAIDLHQCKSVVCFQSNALADISAGTGKFQICAYVGRVRIIESFNEFSWENEKKKFFEVEQMFKFL